MDSFKYFCYKMSIASLIALKQSPFPVIINGTNVITDSARSIFPYPNLWRGDYRSDFPIIDYRTAGFRPRLNLRAIPPDGIRYAFPLGCFETAPFTQFPCYEKSFDCHQSGCCTNDNQDELCVSRIGSR